MIHQQFASQLVLDVDYQAILSPLDNFTQVVDRFFVTGGHGCNVTVPFKEQAFKLCGHVSHAAKVAGAVNTLTIKEGVLCGDNTDGIGLVNDLRRNNVSLSGIRVLLLGAGGAARGIILPLINAGVSAIVIANRTIEKAHQLASLVDPDIVSGCGLDDIPEQSYDLIINASSAGLKGRGPTVSAELVQHSTVCYDMIYSAETTAFCQWGNNSGAYLCIDGLGMLVEQAAESFRLWTGKQPNTLLTLTLLREHLT